MEITALMAQQFTEVFRIGLLAGLIYTTERTRAQTGVLLPLAAGIVFVAIIIPTTMPSPGVSPAHATLTGLVVNAVIVGAMWLGWEIYKRRKGS